MAGDATSYLLGRRLGRQFLVRHGSRVKITEERLQQVEAFFDRHGGPTILIGRFVGLVRAIAPFIAGSSKMSYARFLPYDVLGAGLWATALLLLGYVFWHSLSTALEIAQQGALALGIVIGVGVAIFVGWRHWRQPENRRRTRAWIEEQAQRPAVAPVVRRRCTRSGSALVGPLRFLWRRLTPGDLGLELTSLAAVVGVGSFVFIALLAAVDNGSAHRARPASVRPRRRAALGLGHRRRQGAQRDRHAAGGGDRRGRRGRVPRPPPRGDRRGRAGRGGRADLRRGPRGQGHRGPPAAPRRAGRGGRQRLPVGHAAYSVAYVAVAIAVARALPHWAGRTALVTGALVLASASA